MAKVARLETPTKPAPKKKRIKTKAAEEIDIITLTPAAATKLLEANTINRPLSQRHVDRIAAQISAGLWRFNGDTIKISADNCIVDGQHRLWATILADKPIRTAIVYGVARNAFGTVDTIRKARSGGDALALCGVEKYRRETAVALTWLKRYQDQTIESHRSPRGRVENAEIEMLIENHPDMPKAVERCGPLRNLVSPGLMAFLYYMFTSVDEELADRCLDILENPATISVNHPFFRFRSSLLLSRERKGRREPLVIIALGIKAWNFTREGREIEGLSWRNQGPTKEAFPTIT